MNNRLFVTLGTLFLTFVIGVLGFKASQSPRHTIPEIQSAVAVISGPKSDSPKGIALFSKEKDGIRLSLKIQGLSPGEHGFHIHAYGDLRDKAGKYLGGHFNPEKHPHASHKKNKYHAGDLGNVVADANGNVSSSFLIKKINFYGKFSIIGRSVVVHEKKDDLKTQPSGQAGKRIAYGVIGIVESNKSE